MRSLLRRAGITVLLVTCLVLLAASAALAGRSSWAG
jgi:hypothetical protein